MGMKLPLSVQIKAARLPEPTTEYAFHPERGWRFDLAWPLLKVAAEKEGLARRGGKSRHQTNDGYAEDCVKYSEAALLGWIVIRYTSRQEATGAALDLLSRAILERAKSGQTAT